MPRETRPRRGRRPLYTRDRGGRASAPPPRARRRVGTLVPRVSASPPPRLFLLGATGWPIPPIQPRRRRRRQRQQVNGVPKTLARPTWSSPTELYGAPQGPSTESHRRMRAASCRAKIPGVQRCPRGLGVRAAATHPWASATRSAAGSADRPTAALRASGVGERGCPGNRPCFLKDSVLLFSICAQLCVCSASATEGPSFLPWTLPGVEKHLTRDSQGPNVSGRYCKIPIVWTSALIIFI